MAVRKKEELIETIRSIVGDSDEAITLIEDVNDTLDASSDDEWKKRYEENDKMWREKYISRFTETKDEEEDLEDDGEVKKEKTAYDELFEREES